jgi:alpha-D-ribose 1-methylphosphonate 5-triphosphate synthase subunit PhnI
MRIRRRISAAFKDIPGGQVLGASRDYSHRLLEFGLNEREEKTATTTAFGNPPLGLAGGFDDLGRVSAYLKAQGLLPAAVPDDTPPHDTTMEPLSFPAPRSVRLQTLARGMTQAVMALGYAAIRGFGPAHPTVGELRQGSVAVHVAHPFEPGGERDEGCGEGPDGERDGVRGGGPGGERDDEQDTYYVGSITVTEVESLFEVEQSSGRGLEFGIGYGLVYGCAESKAIAMSVLDNCLSLGDARFPVQDEEFVLYHVDGVEATGFISHLKLPHYVTFQSKLDSTRRTQATAREDGEKATGTPADATRTAGAAHAADAKPAASATRTAGARPDTNGDDHAPSL